jgi:Zn-dependent protease with chaperone function
VNHTVKKVLGIAVSAIISLIAAYAVYVPLWLLGWFLSYAFFKNNPVAYNIAMWVITMLPIILVVVYVVLNLYKDIEKLAVSEMDPESTPILLNPNEKQDDEVNQKIVNAFNKAKEKLGIDKDVKILRLKDSPYINAYALSNLKGENALIVLDGILKLLNEKELQAVIGHELGHIKNKDSLLSVILFASQYVIDRLGYYSTKLSAFVTKTVAKDRDLSFWIKLAVILLTANQMFVNFIILGPGQYILHLINLSISREKEYLADKAGAEAASIEDMVSALKKISGDEIKQKTPLLEFLASTHPPADKRIQHLIELKNNA